MHWDYDSLFAKARLYQALATEEERGSWKFGFWNALTFELLARATLAKVHPVLLAEPQGQYLLAAFGYGKVANPRSIPTRTVIERCSNVVEKFTDKEVTFAMKLLDRRNAELHTAEAAFEEWSPTDWIGSYYRTVQILLEFQGRSLDELLSGDEANTAQAMIDAGREDVATHVKKDIGVKRKFAEGLSETQLAERRALAEPKVQLAIQKNLGRPRLSYRILKTTCPACGSDGVVLSEVVNRSPPKDRDGYLEAEVRMLPTGFRCWVCDLEMDGLSQMIAANMAGYRTEWEDVDPVSQYDVDLSDYIEDHIRDRYEPDYGND